jgi:hypothetical protein
MPDERFVSVKLNQLGNGNNRNHSNCQRYNWYNLPEIIINLKNERQGKSFRAVTNDLFSIKPLELCCWSSFNATSIYPFIGYIFALHTIHQRRPVISAA